MSGGVVRHAMVVRLRPGLAERYAELHRAPWPAVLAALREHGIRNFTIFRRRDVLFGYYEFAGEDRLAALDSLGRLPVMRQWDELMTGLQQGFDDGEVGWSTLEELWHTD